MLILHFKIENGNKISIMICQRSELMHLASVAQKSSINVKSILERVETSNRTLQPGANSAIFLNGFLKHIQHSRLINVILYNSCKCFMF